MATRGAYVLPLRLTSHKAYEFSGLHTTPGAPPRPDSRPRIGRPVELELESGYFTTLYSCEDCQRRVAY